MARLLHTLVTLTTDFGTRDSYVAQMKGVLLSLAAQPLQIIDLSHEVPPQDIRRGARLLAEATPLYPRGTIHVAVVDPGVGTERRIVAVELAGQRYVLPDNGLLSALLDRFPLEAAHVVEHQAVARIIGQSAEGEHSLIQNAAEFGESSTFQGRDIMAPVAAWLSHGGTLSELGAVAGELQRFTTQTPYVEGNVVCLPVESIDRFGNIITSVRRDWLTHCIASPSLVMACNGRNLRLDLVKTYGHRKPGELVALFGSQGQLEFAKVNGSAADELDVRVGDTLRIYIEMGASQS
jgi:S-adenosyl-L-methionine hydrolase (adenosine-forming)